MHFIAFLVVLIAAILSSIVHWKVSKKTFGVYMVYVVGLLAVSAVWFLCP